MAVTGRLARLQFGGTHYGTEEWSCSIHMHDPAGTIPGPGGADFNPAQAYAAPIATWLDAIPGSAQATKLEVVKFNDIDPVTGKYLSQTNSNTWLIPPPVPDGNSTVNAPPQLSVVVGFMTALLRGPASKGRIYAPTGGGGVDATGRLPVASQTQMNTATRTLLNAINAIQSAGNFKAVVFSKEFQSVRAITGVRTGRVVDTQRRRRTSLAEEYVALPLA